MKLYPLTDMRSETGDAWGILETLIDRGDQTNHGKHLKAYLIRNFSISEERAERFSVQKQERVPAGSPEGGQFASDGGGGGSSADKPVDYKDYFVDPQSSSEEDIQAYLAANKRLVAHADEEWETLSQEERDTLHNYTEDSGNLNRHLVGTYEDRPHIPSTPEYYYGKEWATFTPEKQKQLNDAHDEKLAEISAAGKKVVSDFQTRVSELDAMIERSVVPENLVVYRAMNDRSLGKETRDLLKNHPMLASEENLKEMIGKSFEDRAYGSTSLDYKVAQGFQTRSEPDEEDMPENYKADNRVMLRIAVRKGSSGFYFGNDSKKTKFSAEKELLLPRNSKYRITGVTTKTHEGRKYSMLDVELLEPMRASVRKQDYNRHPKGSPDGGKFAPKDGGGGGGVTAEDKPVEYKDYFYDPTLKGEDSELRDAQFAAFEAGNQRLKDHAHQEWETLDWEEQAHLTTYTQDSTRLNGHVTGSYDPERDPDGDRTKDLEERTAHLDAVLEKTTVSEDVVAYRAMSTLSFGESHGLPEYLMNATEEDLGSLVGRSFVDKAYGSTSIDYYVAQGFQRENRIMMRVSVKKGSSGFYFGNDNRKTKYSSERELLLPRNSKYRVTGITGKRYGGVRYNMIDVELLD